MAVEGTISCCLCLITCSRVLGKCSNFRRRLLPQNGGKIFCKGCFRGGKTFFFTGRRYFSPCGFSLRLFLVVMFRNRCVNCGKTRSKTRFLQCGEGAVCRKCYSSRRRSQLTQSPPSEAGMLKSYLHEFARC